MTRITISMAIVGASLIVAASGPAIAADAVVPSGTDWSGLYFGANAGAAMSSGDLTTKTYFDPSPTGYFYEDSVAQVNKAGDQNFNETDFTGGFQAGYNFQQENFVLGIEGDFNYLGLNASKSDGAEYTCVDCGGYFFKVKQDLSVDWLSTVRGRVGFTADKFLVYGTGGIAFGNVDYHAKFSDTNGATESGSTQGVQLGWTAGGGAEWMMSESVSIKVEYLYYDLGSVSAKGSLVYPDFYGDFKHDADVSGSIVRAGVNWHLN